MESKRAVALRYEKQNDAAPRVVAKGSGAVADAIIRLAGQSDVTIHRDPALAESLMALELDSVIPEDLYTAVAEVLAYVYQRKQ